MKHKDYEPIKFEIFQSDMEKMMLILNETINYLEGDVYSAVFKCGLKDIKRDFQHKIDCHKQRGEWK